MATRQGLSGLGLGPVLVLGFATVLLALYLFADLADDVQAQETQLLAAAVVWLQQFRSPALDPVARDQCPRL